jgi:3-hydroxyethyl bacteriochlorophyllide a dehydrogenase
VLLALAATALHGVDRANPQAGDRLLVLGQGPVGQLAARLAHQRGAWVAVADRAPTRLERAVADQVINVDQTPVAEALTEPVSTIIEATGSMAALTAALPRLAQGGTILLLGYYNKLDLPYMPLFLKEAQLLTAKEWAPGDLIRCRDLLAAGTLDVAPLITHCAPIHAVTAAYGTALDDPACLKLVLDWSQL